MDIVKAWFEPADNTPLTLTDEERSITQDFGMKVHICAVSVSHGNDNYVVVKLRKPDDRQPFWQAKFYKGLNGQVFFQPIPGMPISQIVVEVEPGGSLASISDSVLVNISYVRAR